MGAAPVSNVLLFGGGAVGAIAALNIEAGKLGQVTAVLRSNYETVKHRGYNIESIDHGRVNAWRPSSVVKKVPSIEAETAEPFDYIITSTKNLMDVEPMLPDLIAPAVTPGHTVIVMIQNRLNIERAMFEKFPQNIVLSGVSMIDSHEVEPGDIYHEDHDILYLGAFHNPNFQTDEQEIAAARHFIKMYGAAGKTKVHFSEDVPWSRWRKLIFNAVLNPICAITQLDSARARLSGTLIEGIARPAMQEVYDTAKRLGHDLPENIIDTMINLDPMDLYLKPSMQVDLEKGNLMEVEYLVGEPLREAEKVGIPTPYLRAMYEMIKAVQWRLKEAKGLVDVPPKRVQ
ncbi:hypothetical protein M409DRAFT_65127 [Zasmidium cellare ATCC 36951]|uniref:2-dehydropantoate 2-reductase n=1 Tax=Zasmidium cellare ATCC 36951 TaxID=1080233 RepID=A0A6A6CQZ0_ZASCE|nr:uncharacterized protein M409DRAFT_65127 [Zasmidium cellare ATCC 36951]KAF2169491.1 hypothetical protein M409DRAFT_65127 [Zasmidium cellare ATCC 36951]